MGRAGRPAPDEFFDALNETVFEALGGDDEARGKAAA